MAYAKKAAKKTVKKAAKDKAASGKDKFMAMMAAKKKKAKGKK